MQLPTSSKNIFKKKKREQKKKTFKTEKINRNLKKIPNEKINSKKTLQMNMNRILFF
jgi:hypothetical protein